MKSSQNYQQMAQALMQDAARMQPLWDWIFKRFMPRSADALTQATPSADRKRQVIATAADCCAILASAHFSYITPAGSSWFEYKCVDDSVQERYARWYSAVSEATLKELSLSNFYTEIQEVFRSRSGPGTGLMLCEPKKNNKGLIFKHIPVGTYGIAEGIDGDVNTVCRRFKYTAAQAEERWGRRLPNDVLNALNDPTRRFTDTFNFLHLVCPRKSYTNGNGRASVKNMKFLSVYMWEGGDYPILEEGGYPEFPYLCTRYLRWDSVWGFPPVVQVIDSIESIVKMENNMDILSDLAAFPRIFQLADQVGEIDFRAGGVSVITGEAAQLNVPREWGTQGRYDIAKDRIEDKKADIKSAFNTPFVLPITEADQANMTATEVRQRIKEQAVSITPSFSLCSYDLNTLMYRIFCVLFRQGRFNKLSGVDGVPDHLMVPDNDGTENFSIDVPEVQLQGRITKDIKQSQTQGLEAVLEILQGVVQATGSTECLDYIDLPKVIKQAYENYGAPVECIRKESEVKKIQEQRAAAAAEAQQAAVGQQQADAYNKIVQAQSV